MALLEIQTGVVNMTAFMRAMNFVSAVAERLNASRHACNEHFADKPEWEWPVAPPVSLEARAFALAVLTEFMMEGVKHD